MSTIAVRLEPQSIHIRADRHLAFQVLTALDTPAAAADSATRVLSREDARLLVEFHTEGPGLMGGRKVYRTVEWVTPHEPDLIEFEGVEGPLPMLRDRLILDDSDGCTTLRYESEFGIRWGLAGWLLAVLAVRRALRRLVRSHLREMKQTIEERAERSRVFPQRCVHDGP